MLHIYVCKSNKTLTLINENQMLLLTLVAAYTDKIATKLLIYRDKYKMNFTLQLKLSVTP